MKSVIAWCVTLLLALAPQAYASETSTQIATRLLDHLDAARYSDAEAMFSAEMKAAVPADKLQAVWESLPAQLGALGERGTARTAEHQGMQIVIIPLPYAKATMQAQVAIDGQGLIAGFMIQPGTATPAPAPAADAAFNEVDFNLPARGDNRAALPGTLSLPKGAGTFPVVVLVHGSGPQDRDESAGPNRPFLDIARGLAEQGIAAYRYDKRTRAHPREFSGEFSVDDETTDDAVAAVAALAADPRIDAKRIYVLGHSQGGMLAGRIANKSDKRVAGLILLAAPARPLLDLVAEQNRYLVSLDGSISAEDQTHLDAVDAAIAAVRIDPKATLINLPGKFWQDLEAIDPVADVRDSGLPTLLLQGGRDFQVIDADWQRWNKLLTGERYRFHLYPKANHFGINGEGKGSLEEYQIPGKVNAALINDIAQWIKR